MSQRSDPLVPILGAAVALVVLGAVGLVFYPRISRWFGPEKTSVSGARPLPNGRVAVWVCRSVPGVALLLEAGQNGAGLDQAVLGGPFSYLRLSVYNFGRTEPFLLDLSGKFSAPDGGLVPAALATRLRPDLPAEQLTILHGIGAVDRVRVPEGHLGIALLVIGGDPAEGRSFALDELMFERRELKRQALAEWRRHPDLKQFQDF